MRGRGMTPQELRDAFVERYGPGPVRVFFAPGRVNLIGAHVHYNGGVVLPFAIDLGVQVAIRPRGDARLRMASVEFPGARETDLGELAKNTPAREWFDYPVGALKALAERGPLRSGADLLFSGTVPPGAGLSSSAALLVSTLFAISEVQ